MSSIGQYSAALQPQASLNSMPSFLPAFFLPSCKGGAAQRPTQFSSFITFHQIILPSPKLATPGGDKYPLPSQVYRLLGTKVNLIASPREIQVLPSRIDSICCELNQILSSKKLGKGHASEIFG